MNKRLIWVLIAVAVTIVAGIVLGVWYRSFLFEGKMRAESWSALVEAVVLIVLIIAGAVAWQQLKAMQNIARRELVRNLMNDWTGPQMTDVRILLFDTLDIAQLGPSEIPRLGSELKEKLLEMAKLKRMKVHVGKLYRIPHYFEMVSTICRPEKKTEESKEIIKLLMTTIIYFYELYKPWITEIRQGQGTAYTGFENLYDLAIETQRVLTKH